MTSITGGHFKLTNTNYFYLPGNKHMLHICTISCGFQEYICMLHVQTSQVYIEEVVLESKDLQKDVWANFKFIDDDNLAADLAAFCYDKQVLDIKRIHSVISDGGIR